MLKLMKITRGFSTAQNSVAARYAIDLTATLAIMFAGKVVMIGADCSWSTSVNFIHQVKAM